MTRKEQNDIVLGRTYVARELLAMGVTLAPAPRSARLYVVPVQINRESNRVTVALPHQVVNK